MDLSLEALFGLLVLFLAIGTLGSLLESKPENLKRQILSTKDVKKLPIPNKIETFEVGINGEQHIVQTNNGKSTNEILDLLITANELTTEPSLLRVGFSYAGRKYVVTTQDVDTFLEVSIVFNGLSSQPDSLIRYCIRLAEKAKQAGVANE